MSTDIDQVPDPVRSDEVSKNIYEAPIPALAEEVSDIDTLGYPSAPPFPGRPTGDSQIILPRWIHIQDRQGRYLVVRSGPPQALLTFEAGPPNLNHAFETEITWQGPSRYALYANNGNRVMGFQGVINPNEGWYSADVVPPNQIPHFVFILARGDTVYIQDTYTRRYFLSNQLRSTGAPLGRNFINADSEMTVSIAAARREILNVEYNILTGRVHEVPPRFALRTTVRNDSHSSDATQALEYTYEKWAVGTWNNSAGLEIGASASFRAGIPFVFSASFDISFTAAYTHEWGREEGTREVVTSTTSVVVPPRKRANVQVIIRNAHIDIAFTYTERVLWSNGQTHQFQRNGIYTNVDSWHVDVVVSDWEDV